MSASSSSRRGEAQRVLFVCLGNICRSPLAEGVFLHLARERGLADRFEADSCGTGGWHVGEEPDHRALDVARRNGITLRHRARLLDPERDFERFDLIVAMDRNNLEVIRGLGCPADRAHLLRSFEPEMKGRDLEVPDPYWGDRKDFDQVYSMLMRACGGLLDHLVGRA